MGAIDFIAISRMGLFRHFAEVSFDAVQVGAPRGDGANRKIRYRKRPILSSF
jgi:hypothetical protein